MDTWPYPNIPPELFEALSNDDKRLLEALTQILLAEFAARQQRQPLIRS